MLRKNYRKVFILSLIVMMLLFSGCSKNNNNLNANNTMPERGIVELTPSELLDDNLKKLKPHLGIIFGCAHVKYSGPKNNLSTKYEIWENGEMIKSKESMGVIFDDFIDSDFSISLRNISTDNEEEIYRLTTVIHEAGSTSTIDNDIKIPKFNDDSASTVGRAPIAISEIKEISDDEEITLWAYIAADSFRTDDAIEDEVENARWAFVYKIKFSDSE